MSEGSSVLEDYAKSSPVGKGYTPGRLLFCADCMNFTKHAVVVDGDDKVTICRVCEQPQSRMVRVMKSEWMDERYVDNFMLVSLMVVGDASMAKALKVASTPPEVKESMAKRLKSKLKARRKTIAERKVKVAEAVESEQRAEVSKEKQMEIARSMMESSIREALWTPERGQEMMDEVRRDKRERRRRPRKSVPVRPKYRKTLDAAGHVHIEREQERTRSRLWTRVLPAVVVGLGLFHGLLTYLAWNYRFFLWPFTYAWDAFVWIPVATQVYLAITAILIGLATSVIMWWRRRNV